MAAVVFICVCCMLTLLTLLLCVRPLSLQEWKCTQRVHCRGTEVPQVNRHLAAMLSEPQCCYTFGDMQLNSYRYCFNIGHLAARLPLPSTCVVRRTVTGKGDCQNKRHHLLMFKIKDSLLAQNLLYWLECMSIVVKAGFLLLY